MLEINKNPSRRDLAWFGPMFFLAFGIVGLVLFLAWKATIAAYVVWSIATLVTILYLVVPPIRRRIYVGWMYLTYPIGWVVSHVMLGIIYYLVLTPIGLVMRIVGRDPLERRLDRDAGTYWSRHEPAGDASRYFKQF